jgi:hypothetical protein
MDFWVQQEVVVELAGQAVTKEQQAIRLPF